MARRDKKSLFIKHTSSTRDWSAHLNLFKKGLCIWSDASSTQQPYVCLHLVSFDVMCRVPSVPFLYSNEARGWRDLDSSARCSTLISQRAGLVFLYVTLPHLHLALNAKRWARVVAMATRSAPPAKSNFISFCAPSRSLSAAPGARTNAWKIRL